MSGAAHHRLDYDHASSAGGASSPDSAVAAWVDAVAVSVREVDRTVEELIKGPRAALLPRPGSAQYRNMRRWVVQLLTAQLLLQDEFDRRGLTPVAPGSTRSGPAAALQAGGIAAAVIANSPAAAAVAADVTSGIEVAEQSVRAYFERNGDRYPRPTTYDHVRAVIAADLLQAARTKAFGVWLDSQVASRVALNHGFEHPADPRQPDATHHH